MKGKAMKSMLRLAVIFAALVTSSLSYAVTALEFEGPKETYLDTVKPFPVTDPGNFDFFNFISTDDKPDVAVPTFRNFVQGLDNLNNWAEILPNKFFKHNYLSGTKGKEFIAAHQVVKGNFDGNPKPDLLIVSLQHLIICYNYDGHCHATDATTDTPADFSEPIPIAVNPGTKEEIKIAPIAAVVADFTGEGQVDVAVVGWAYKDGFKGFFTVLKGNGGGAADPLARATPLYGPQEIPDGAPLTLVAGDFDGDGKKDVMTANVRVPYCQNSVGSFLYSFKGTGGSFTPNLSQTFKVNECVLPTGLIAPNPDEDGKSDLILTCYMKSGPRAPANSLTNIQGKIVANFCGNPVPGPVTIFKSAGDAVGFSEEQTLDGLDFPANSTAADFNKDGNLDVVVAVHSPLKAPTYVATYAGKAPFQVHDPGNKIPTKYFQNFFINHADMNKDGFEDVVVVARDLKFNRWIQPPTSVDTISRIDARFQVRAQIADYAADTAYFASDTNVLAEGLANAPKVAQRTYIREANGFKANYVQAEQQNFMPANVYIGQFKENPNYFRPIDRIAVPQPTDGVLVLINTNPVVSIDDPGCERPEVAYRCTAPENHKVTECKCTTSDPGVTCTDAAATGADNREWVGKVKVALDNAAHTFNIAGTITTTAGENPKTVTGEYTVGPFNCPTGGACPAKPLAITIWSWFPVSVCPDKSIVEGGGTITDWEITSGPARIGFDDGSGIGALSMSGSCLEGTLGLKDEDRFTEEVRIEGNYGIKGVAERCPFVINGKAVEFRGTGKLGCGLALGSVAAYGDILGLAGALFASIAGLLGLRMRQRK